MPSRILQWLRSMRAALKAPLHSCSICDCPLFTDEEIAAGRHLGANEIQCETDARGLQAAP